MPSDLSSHRKASAEVDVFRAMLISGNRTSVLAALLEEAAAHFGHDELTITNVRVATDDHTGLLLASADVTSRRSPAHASVAPAPIEVTAADRSR